MMLCFQQVLLDASTPSAAAAAAAATSSHVAHSMSVADRSDTDVPECTSDSSRGAVAHELPIEKALNLKASSHIAEVSNSRSATIPSACIHTAPLNKHTCALLALLSASPYCDAMLIAIRTY